MKLYWQDTRNYYYNFIQVLICICNDAAWPMKSTRGYFKPSYSIGQGYQLDRQTPWNFQNNTSAMRKMLLTSGINYREFCQSQKTKYFYCQVNFCLIEILLFFFPIIPQGGLINPDWVNEKENSSKGWKSCYKQNY